MNEEEEVLNIRLLPTWFKVGSKVDIQVGRFKNYYGYIKKIKYSENYEDGITRAQVDIPGSGKSVFKVCSLRKSNIK